MFLSGFCSISSFSSCCAFKVYAEVVMVNELDARKFHSSFSRVLVKCKVEENLRSGIVH